MNILSAVTFAVCLFTAALSAPTDGDSNDGSDYTPPNGRWEGGFQPDGDPINDGDGGNSGNGGYQNLPPGKAGGWVRGQQPNIVLVVADDLGFNDVGWNGSPDIKTPNMDALAADGVILGNYYVQPVCTPSRVQLLSGVHEVAAGLCHEVIHSGQRNALPSNLPTLANKLQEVGYATHLVGKWNLGHWDAQFLPTNRGFNSFYGFLNALTEHYTHVPYERFFNAANQWTTFIGHDFYENDQPSHADDGKYATHLFTSRVEKIVNDHVNGPNRKQPFFIDLSYSAPHWPLQVPDQYLAQYANIRDDNRRLYAAMVSAMDEGIGNITRALKSVPGLWEQTVFIFTTDNGGVDMFGGNNFPLRGRKQTFWEGGVRGVGFINSPWIHQKYRGNTEQAFTHISDWYPTLAYLAGASTSGQALYGNNIWATINGDTPSPRTELLHGIDPVIPLQGVSREGSPFDTRISASLRVGDWKIITGNPVDGNWYQSPAVDDVKRPRVGPKPPNDQIIGQEQLEPGYIIRPHIGGATQNVWLFNIAQDPRELNDLSATRSDKVDELLARLAWYKANLMVPCRFPRQDLNANPVNHNGEFVPWVVNGQPLPTF